MFSWIVKAYAYLLHYKKKKYLIKLLKNGMKLGKNVSIIDTFFFDPSHCFLISIGDDCTICPGVRLIAHDASTYRFFGYTKIGKIRIGNGCFIGDSVIVLPGVSIGDGSIIGAGSVVTNNIQKDTVAAGNPAKTICSVEEYLTRIKSISKDKKIFDESYYIEKLDEYKRKEILQSVSDHIGFIV